MKPAGLTRRAFCMKGANVNKERRKELDRALKLLEHISSDDVASAKEILESERDGEQEAFDNMPEGLQSGERGERMTAAIEAMERAIEALDGFDVDEIRAAIEEACE